MKKFLYLFLAVFLVSCGSDNTANISSGTSDGGASVKISTASILSQMDRATYKDGEVLVKFRSGTVSTSSVKAHQAVGAKVVKKFKLVKNLEKVELPDGVSVKEAVQAYLADPNVDAFILGDLDSAALGEANMKALQEAVAAGKGFIMLGGYHSFGPGGYRGTPLEEGLPIVIGPFERQDFNAPE